MSGSNLYGAPAYTPGPGGGQPGNLTLVGSGFSVPAGIEAALEYNGLLMNIRENVDRYHITSIDGLLDADVRDTRDVNTDDDGETTFNSFYGGKTIVIAGEIRTYSVPKLRDMQSAMRAAFLDLSTEYPLIFRTGDFNKDHFIRCKKIVPIAGVEQQSDRRAARNFQITLRASNPRFLSYYQHSVITTPPIPSTNYHLATLHNAGDYWAEPIYRIYGPASSVTIENDTTGKSFTVIDIPSGIYFEYNIEKKEFKNDLGADMWDFLDDDADYVRLKKGDNQFFYTGDSPRVEIAWRDSW